MKKAGFPITAVVLGSGEIWLDIITKLLHQNAIVIVPAKDYEEIKKLSSYATITNGRLITLLTDIPDYHKAAELLEVITAKYGKIDLTVSLFDNYKYEQMPDTLLLDLKCNEFEQMVNDNIINHFISCQLILHSMKKNKHGVYICISNIIPENERPFFRFASLIEKMQVEMSRIFSSDISSTGVRYYHLFAGNAASPVTNEDPNKANMTNEGAISHYIIDLYTGMVNHPEDIFQYCITL